MNIESRITKKTLRDIEKITGGKLTLGKLMWAIRESENERQIDFSEKLGISRQQLCDIEHNRKAISPKLAALYARKLGYPEEQFVRLSLQDMIDRDGLHFSVELRPDKISGESYQFAHA